MWPKVIRPFVCNLLYMCVCVWGGGGYIYMCVCLCAIYLQGEVTIVSSKYSTDITCDCIQVYNSVYADYNHLLPTLVINLFALTKHLVTINMVQNSHNFYIRTYIKYRKWRTSVYKEKKLLKIGEIPVTRQKRKIGKIW